MHAYRVCAMAVAGALALAGCGGEGAGGQNAGAQPAAAPEAAAGPEPVATGDLRCPAPVREGLPGPDIIGLRLGMTADEALATARCALGTDAEVSTANRWLDRLDAHGVELGTQTFTVRKGEHRPCDFRREWQECEGGLKWLHVDEVVTVATPGAPGAETAHLIRRAQHFREGAMPPVQALLGALVAKYGEPQWTEESDKPRGHSAGHRRLEWVRDHAGHPMATANPLFHRCRGAVNAHPDATGAKWSDGCGLSIQAWIALSGRNPALAMEVGTAMLHQGSLYAHVEAMQDELRRLGQARREAEVQAAEARDVRL